MAFLLLYKNSFCSMKNDQFYDFVANNETKLVNIAMTIQLY